MKADARDAVGVTSILKCPECLAVGLCGLLMLSQLSCRRSPSAPPPTPVCDALAAHLPPDLSRCKRVEIRFAPSTLEFICITPRGRLLLNAEETRYLESAAPFITDDPQAIQALAEDVASSTYEGPVIGTSGVQYQMHFVCYDESERVISFTTVGNIVEVGNVLEADGHRFKNHGIRLRILVPQAVPYQLRVACARHLRNLHDGLQWYVKEEKSYPAATEWYDATLNRYRVRGYTSNVDILAKAIRCPSASEGQCHYAINSGCQPNSPPDTVLLFESRPGRNQHGGPELFAFDNHDPRGGLVLLHDGTVKFIRTERELKDLRWK